MQLTGSSNPVTDSILSFSGAWGGGGGGGGSAKAFVCLEQHCHFPREGNLQKLPLFVN